MASTKNLIPAGLLRRSARTLCQTAKIKKEQTTAIIDDAPIKRIKLEPPSLIQCQIFTDAKRTVGPTQPDGYLLVDEEELDLERTLLGGQSFRWAKRDCDDSKEGQVTFTGTVANNVFQLWRCDSKRVAYNILNIEALESKDAIETFLGDYFQLKYKLVDLYKFWSEKDENFRQCSQHYKGFRILRQDPVENLLSFICATNNNIKRISLMICGLCRRFGQKLLLKERATFESSIEDRFYTFPTVERLAEDDVFNVLRYELGFGYRAKFICETAKMLMSLSSSGEYESPRNYLIKLRETPYKETCQQLQKFPGIGRKVADCICLMSMDHLNSVPIDCHIYEIVCRNYMKTLRQERKTLTEKVHDLIGDYFVDLHGPLAGWATSVLFVGELKHLKQSSDKNTKRVVKKTRK
jgi:N-glycosylase/DNA lyase